MGLRIKLRSSKRDSSRIEPLHTKVTTNAERCKKYRQKIKENPQSYQKEKAIKALKSRLYRLNLSEEKKKHANELTKLRMRKYREQVKRKASDQKVDVLEVPNTRGKELEREKQRRVWKEKKQAQRAKFNFTKKDV